MNSTTQYPLSSISLGMFQHHQTSPQQQYYIQQLQVTLYGEIDFSKLDNALKQLSNQHSIFKYTIKYNQSHSPYFEVQNELTSHFTEVSLIEHIQPDLSKAINCVLHDEREFFRTLIDRQLLKFCFIRCSHRSSIVVLTYPHLIMDGRSAAFSLINELFDHYENIHIESNRCNHNRFEYAEFTKVLTNKLSKEQQAIWKTLLTSQFSPSRLSLPRPPANNENPRYCQIRDSLDSYIDSTHLTLLRNSKWDFDTLIYAAWTKTISRYSYHKNDDVCFHISQYHKPEKFEQTLGLFLTTLPLQITTDYLDDDHSLLKHIQNYKSKALSCVHHSLNLIQQTCKYPISGQSIETLVVLQSPYENIKTKRRSFTIEATNLLEKVPVPLNLIVDRSDSIDFELIYDESQFFYDDIRSVLDSFCNTLLSFIIENTFYQKFSASIVSGYMTTAGNEDNLINLVTRSVRHYPEKIAIRDNLHRISYEELDGLSNYLAQYMHGLDPTGTVVAVIGEKSVFTVIAYLAILKLSRTIVPIPQHTNTHRVGQIITESQVTLALLSKDNNIDLSNFNLLTIPLTNTFLQNISVENFQSPDTDNNPAFVLFTSGTTTTPKGVLISHEGLVNHINWLIQEADITENDCCLLRSSISFDISIREIFAPLATGAQLVVVNDELSHDPAEVEKIINAHRVTLLHCTPPILNLFLKDRLFEKTATLRWVSCGGDIVTSQQVKNFKKQCHAKFYITYGLTETSVSVMRARRIIRLGDK